MNNLEREKGKSGIFDNEATNSMHTQVTNRYIWTNLTDNTQRLLFIGQV